MKGKYSVIEWRTFVLFERINDAVRTLNLPYDYGLQVVILAIKQWQNNYMSMFLYRVRGKRAHILVPPPPIPWASKNMLPVFKHCKHFRETFTVTSHLRRTTDPRILPMRLQRGGRRWISYTQTRSREAMSWELKKDRRGKARIASWVLVWFPTGYKLPPPASRFLILSFHRTLHMVSLDFLSTEWP